MTKKNRNHYDWKIGGRLPDLERHSQAKHDILRNYLVRYVQTLVSSPRQDALSLTIVDGFAGGGLYRDKGTGLTVPGSPLLVMEACQEAKARIMINHQRRKDLILDVDYIFVEAGKAALAHLEYVLTERGISFNQQSSRVYVRGGEFAENADDILRFIKGKSKRAGKAIFVLDQYSYDDVELNMLNRILHSVPKAEIILTFNVGALLTYLNPRRAKQFALKTGMPNPLDGIGDLDLLKQDRNWRFVVERNLIGRLKALAQAEFFTPFFLRPVQSHGDLWLVHLARHAKANDVMKETHWEGGNYIHYGTEGFDMMGYDATRPLEEQISLLGAEYEFDVVAAARTHIALLDEIPRSLSNDAVVPFGEFVATHCNGTPATREMIAKAAFELSEAGEIELRSEKDRTRRSSTAVHDSDVIRLPRQIRLL